MINQNKEKVKQWIHDQAKKFKETYFTTSPLTNEISLSETTKDVKLGLLFNSGLNVLKRLQEVVNELDLKTDIYSINIDDLLVQNKINAIYLSSLKEISNIVNETDISSFEMIHSGLIGKLTGFLSLNDDSNLLNIEKKFNQTQRSSHYQLVSSTFNPVYLNDLDTIIKNDFKILRCKEFLNVFSNLPLSFQQQQQQQIIKDLTKTSLFSILLSKLHNCVNQLEQFAVRVHDVPTSVGYGKTAAIKFFNTHQFKSVLLNASTSYFYKNFNFFILLI